MVALTLGIDVACRAAHQAALARDGVTVWRGRKFNTRPADLDRLWADLDLDDPAELTVVLEPTRNAWIVLAEWFRRRGVRVVMVPTTQSADLRKYYSKHTKNDRVDSELLARLPLLHPEGLRQYSGQGPADPLRRLTKQRSTLVKRRTAVLARLDAQIELLGPAWYAVLGSNYGIAALEFLTRYADPHPVIRLGQARLTRFLIRHSRGSWRDDHAEGLVMAALGFERNPQLRWIVEVNVDLFIRALEEPDVVIDETAAADLVASAARRASEGAPIETVIQDYMLGSAAFGTSSPPGCGQRKWRTWST